MTGTEDAVPLEMEADVIDSDDEDVMEVDKVSLAEEHKQRGNAAVKAGDAYTAIEEYTKAIELTPENHLLYGNRSAAYMMLYKYVDAVRDSEKAISIAPDYVKGYLRAASSCMQQGKFLDAEIRYKKALELEEKPSTLADLETVKKLQKEADRGKDELEKKRYDAALTTFIGMLRTVPRAVNVRLWKADTLIGLKRFEQASKLAGEVLGEDSQNAVALGIRGCALYYLDNMPMALNHFKTALQCNPDDTRSARMLKTIKKLERAKEAGNEAFKARKFDEALSLYSEALAIDPDNVSINSKLYNNRAAAYTKLGKLKDAVNDCTQAIELDSTYQKAYMRRAQCYMDLKNFEEAVRDYERLKEMDPRNRDIAGKVREAKLELKKANRKDYYKILGVSQSASEADIKRGYKKMAFKYHPDKNNGTEEESQEAEKMFKDVGEAFAVLSDERKRQMYDQGMDLEEIEQGGMGGGFHGGMDPSSIFEMFNMGGGGFSFGGGGGGGFGGGFGGHGGGFPFG